MGTVPSLGHSRVVVKFKAGKKKQKNIKEKPDGIYIKCTVISIYRWNQLPTHHPCNFSYTLKYADIKQMERKMKGVWRKEEMKGRWDDVYAWRRGRKRGKHVSVRLPFPSTSLFIILCLLRLFKGALLLCHFLAGASFFFLPLPLFVASAGRMTGDYSTAACSAGLYHTVHAKYSPLRASGTEGSERLQMIYCVHVCLHQEPGES